MDKAVIRVANIIEDGRLAGPQVRITEVSKAIGSLDKIKYINSSHRGVICNSQPAKIETTVIFPKHESEVFKNRLLEYEISYIQLPIYRLSKKIKYLLQYTLWFFIEIFLLWRVLKTKGFNVAHISGGSWQIKGVIAGKLAGCRVLWHLNDTKMYVPVRFIFRILSGWFVDGFILSANKVHEYYLKSFRQSDKKKSFLIMPPVNCKHFDSKNIASKSPFSSRNTIKIATVANINPLKGLEYFIKMAYRLNSLYPNQLEFYIVGPCYDSQIKYFYDLKGLADRYNLDNLFFLGQITDIKKVYFYTDIYICSSLTESGPMSLFEAMSMGKSVISTDVGDVKNILIHGENAFIVPPGDDSELVQYTIQLIDNPDLRKEFGRKSRTIAEEKLDVLIAAQRHIEAYQSIMN